MKLFKRLKEFITNVSSGDYDHATRSMNEFIATGKFPEKAMSATAEYVDPQTVEIQDQVIYSTTKELNDLHQKVSQQAADNKKVKIKK